MALTRALARGLGFAVTAQNRGTWIRSEIGDLAPLVRLRGKTMLVVGLGGIGTEVARLASAAEMRVTGIRSSRRSGPPFVDRVGLTEDLATFAAEADVVVNCLPMTPDTVDIFDEALFQVMKSTAFFINVGRGGTVDTDALITALTNGEIAGAGLDVTDPEPLPAGPPSMEGPKPHHHPALCSVVGYRSRAALVALPRKPQTLCCRGAVVVSCRSEARVLIHPPGCKSQDTRCKAVHPPAECLQLGALILDLGSWILHLVGGMSVG